MTAFELDTDEIVTFKPVFFGKRESEKAFGDRPY